MINCRAKKEKDQGEYGVCPSHKYTPYHNSVIILGRKRDMSAVKTKEELLDALLEHKDTIKKYGVNKIGIFGSFTKGSQDEESDVDFLVEFLPDKKNFKNFMNLAFFLEDLLHRKVEVVTVESLSPYLKPFILQEVEYVLS